MLHVIPPLLKTQHTEILKVIERFEALLNQGSSPNQAEELKTTLNEISRRLTIHLAQEDCILYPALAIHKNQNHRSIAKQFTLEMGGLADTFDTFASKWKLGKHIQNNAEKFRAEAKGIIAALRSRIDREEKELFPLLTI